jgi:predicted NAD/FAD-binding protein
VPLVKPRVELAARDLHLEFEVTAVVLKSKSARTRCEPPRASRRFRARSVSVCVRERPVASTVHGGGDQKFRSDQANGESRSAASRPVSATKRHPDGR